MQPPSQQQQWHQQRLQPRPPQPPQQEPPLLRALRQADEPLLRALRQADEAMLRALWQADAEEWHHLRGTPNLALTCECARQLVQRSCRALRLQHDIDIDKPDVTLALEPDKFPGVTKVALIIKTDAGAASFWDSWPLAMLSGQQPDRSDEGAELMAHLTALLQAMARLPVLTELELAVDMCPHGNVLAHVLAVSCEQLPGLRCLSLQAPGSCFAEQQAPAAALAEEEQQQQQAPEEDQQQAQAQQQQQQQQVQQEAAPAWRALCGLTQLTQLSLDVQWPLFAPDVLHMRVLSSLCALEHLELSHPSCFVGSGVYEYGDVEQHLGFLQMLSRLTQLQLQPVRDVDGFVAATSSLRRLRRLRVAGWAEGRGMPPPAADAAWLGQLPDVTHLELASGTCALIRNPAFPPAIGQLCALQELLLGELTPTGLAALARLTSLTRLDVTVGRCEAAADEQGVLCPSVRAMALSSGRVPWRTFPGVTELVLGSVLEPAQLSAIAQHCKQLVVLRTLREVLPGIALEHHSVLSDERAAAIRSLTGLSGLTELCWAPCDVELELHALAGVTQLRSLCIEACPIVSEEAAWACTPAALTRLLGGARQLTRLEICVWGPPRWLAPPLEDVMDFVRCFAHVRELVVEDATLQPLLQQVLQAAG